LPKVSSVEPVLRSIMYRCQIISGSCRSNPLYDWCFDRCKIHLFQTSIPARACIYLSLKFLLIRIVDRPGRFPKLFSTRTLEGAPWQTERIGKAQEGDKKRERERERERERKREEESARRVQRGCIGVNAAQPTSPEGRLEARVQESLAGLPFYPSSRRKGAHLHTPRTPFLLFFVRELRPDYCLPPFVPYILPTVEVSKNRYTAISAHGFLSSRRDVKSPLAAATGETLQKGAVPASRNLELLVE